MQTRSWHPTRCPAHPLSGQLVSKTTTHTGAIPLRHSITQHSCGEPGCDTYLGWEYHGPGKDFQAGPGRCDDTNLLLLTAQGKHDQETLEAICGILLLLSLILPLIWWPILALTLDNTWSSWHTVAAVLTAAADLCASLTYWRHARRLRPTPDTIPGIHS